MLIFHNVPSAAAFKMLISNCTSGFVVSLLKLKRECNPTPLDRVGLLLSLSEGEFAW